MKKILIIIFLFLSVKSFAQSDTALGLRGKKIPIKSLSLLHPLYNPNDSTVAFDSARYYMATFAYNGTNDSLVITFLDGTRFAVAKPASTGGTGSGWKTVNTNDMTDTLSGNVAIGNGLSTPIAKLQINVTGIGATQPDSSKGILLINPTAATSGNQQFSPSIWWQGNNWKTGSSSSTPASVGAYVKTVQGATSGVGYLTFLWRGLYGNVLTTKPDLLTIGSSSESNFAVGIGTTPSNTAGAVLNVGGSINQVSGNYSVSSPWNLNVSGAPLIDYTSTTGLLRLLNNSTFNGTVTDKPIAVGRSDSTDLGAQLSVTSIGRGFLPPRMTTTQRDSIDLRITGFTIANGGTGYTGTGPTLAASAGPTPSGVTTASFSGTQWTVSGGVITANTILGIQFGGSYNSTPTLTPLGGGGSGAVIYPVMTQFLTAGMVIYNTTVNSLQQWNGTRWVNLGLSGTATLASGTVTVSTPAARTDSKIFVSCNTPSGTQGFLSVPDASIVSGTSFIINSSNAADNSTVNWTIK